MVFTCRISMLLKIEKNTCWILENIRMFRLPDNKIFDNEDNNSDKVKSLHYEVHYAHHDVCKSNIDKFNKLLDKNKISTKLILDMKTDNSVCTEQFFEEIKIPLSITVLSINKIHFVRLMKFKLPPSIQKLKLGSIADLFKIDFSGNSNLKIIKIKTSEFADHNCIRDTIDMSHIITLQKICFMDNENNKYWPKEHLKSSHTFFKQATNRLIMGKIRLPYGCSIDYNWS